MKGNKGGSGVPGLAGKPGPEGKEGTTGRAGEPGHPGMPGRTGMKKQNGPIKWMFFPFIRANEEAQENEEEREVKGREELRGARGSVKGQLEKQDREAQEVKTADPDSPDQWAHRGPGDCPGSPALRGRRGQRADPYGSETSDLHIQQICRAMLEAELPLLLVSHQQSGCSRCTPARGLPATGGPMGPTASRGSPGSRAPWLTGRPGIPGTSWHSGDQR
ncbi:hypothetical protein CRUP_016457 [Coryphaenoides rupestris]|nr:hypothetical protein CRUP_016457 [Coryphaenoides rupestris]